MSARFLPEPGGERPDVLDGLLILVVIWACVAIFAAAVLTSCGGCS